MQNLIQIEVVRPALKQVSIQPCRKLAGTPKTKTHGKLDPVYNQLHRRHQNELGK